MAKRIVRHGQRARAAVRALEDACTPIEEALYAAKETYWAALEGGNRATILEAKAVKQAAAERLEETRTWLRREAEIVKLQTRTIPRLQEILAGPMLVKHGDNDAREDPQARAEVEQALKAARQELETLTAAAIPLRRDLEALGGVVAGDPVPADLPPGSADVTAPSITVAPRTRATARKDKG
ncbi:hypothetical protein ITP53_11255 [Nonomuraea sp. K274]|uniref:Uncharacterized protein n=1 Tax=Nonomuraea cypriaca TaxID=1187855 RepID=A0A931A7A1_9ACTN|nr:hypothetical protein [Nonomuraea cypriaca]MBF8186315.1 hypothetical protein [Nonomuraea cypriaca]